jgi:FkbM family methyltransferase
MPDNFDPSLPFGHYAATPLQSRLMALGHAMPATWAGRRVTSLIRSFLKRWSSRPIDAVRLGSRMRLYPRGNAGEKRLMTSPQFFDPIELELLGAMLHPGFVFFDIGANVGTYTLFVASRVGRSGTIVAVEPHPTSLDRLRHNLALNGIDWVRIAPVALAERPGMLDLHIDDRNLGSSSLMAGPAGSGQSIKVPCRTLESLVEEEGVTRIDAIKIDIEGVEDRVLMPYFSSVPDDKWPQLLVIEDNRKVWKQDLPGMLRRIGYVTAAERSANLVVRRGNGARS